MPKNWNLCRVSQLFSRLTLFSNWLISTIPLLSQMHIQGLVIPSKSLTVAFGQFKTNITFYCPTTKGSVSSLKKLKDKVLKKNSDSVRQRHCLRLSEQMGGGGEHIPPSLAHLGLLQSLKYTQNRQTYSWLLKGHSQHHLQKG